MELKTAEKKIRWQERVGIMAIGHTFKQVEEFVFDYLLYTAAIAWLGPVIGGLIMTVFSALICYFYILAYDRLKKDWFGLELLKEFRDGEEREGWLGRLVRKIARKGDWAAFLVLSGYTDPFMTTVYLRKGAAAYNGLSRRDWKVFWGSVLVANLWWTGAVTLAVVAFKTLIGWLGL